MTMICKKSLLICFLSLMLLVTGCKLGVNEKVPELLFEKELIDQYTPGIYIFSVMDIIFHNGHYFVVDARIGSVFVYDNKFNLIKQIGKIGKGPMEYIAVIAVNVSDKFIFISDYALNCIDKYDRESLEFIERLNMPPELHVPFGNFHATDNNIFVLNKISKGNCEIIKYHYDSKLEESIHNFGINTGKSMINYTGYNSQITLGIESHSNIIKVLSLKENTLIKDLEIELPKPAMRIWEKLMNDGKNPPLFTDAYVDNGVLFLSFQDFEEKRSGLAKVELDKDFNILSTKWYYFRQSYGDNVFCVIGDKLISFSSVKSNLNQYKIPKSTFK